MKMRMTAAARREAQDAKREAPVAVKAPKVKAEKPALETRKEVPLREVPVVIWNDCYSQGWQSMIVPEAFAH